MQYQFTQLQYMQLFLNLTLNPTQSILYSNHPGTLAKARDTATQNHVD
jgi:hypothetical protein